MKLLNEIYGLSWRNGPFMNMTRKDFMNKFSDLCQDAWDQIPPNLSVEILGDYAVGLIRWKNFLAISLKRFKKLCAQAELWGAGSNRSIKTFY